MPCSSFEYASPLPGGMADALSIDDDVMFLAFSTALDDVCDQLLLIIIILSRNAEHPSAVCDTTQEPDIRLHGP